MLDIQLDTDPRRLKAARIAGVDHVDTTRLDLSTLRKRGILVWVTVSGSSLFTRKARYIEYGIADKDERKERYTPGSKFVFPRKYANKWHSIENRCRETLDELSHDLTGFAPYRWLPWKAIPKWRAKFEQYEAEAAELVAELIDTYPTILSELSEEFAESAHRTWVAVIAQGYTEILFDKRPCKTEEEFVAAVVEAAISRVPTTDDIRAGLRLSYRVSLVHAQEDIAADNMRAANIAEQEELLRSQFAAKREEAFLTAKMLRNEENHQQRMFELEERAQEAEAEALIRAEMERARAGMTETARYIDEVTKSVRDRIATSAAKMLQSIESNGFVRVKIAEKGNALLELYELLSVRDDRKLRDMLLDLRAKIGPTGSARAKDALPRDPQSVSATLQNIMDLADEEVEDFTTDGRGAYLEL